MVSDALSLFAIAVSVIAIIISIYYSKKTSTENTYLCIDTNYMELLKMAIEHPKLRDIECTSHYSKLTDKQFKKMYDTYAFMCWNLVETIYDQQQNWRGKFKISPTWMPVVAEENRLHFSWFKQNRRLFKKKFQNFVIEEFNNIEIADGALPDLEKIFPSFENDFAEDERKELEHLDKLVTEKTYRLLLAKHKHFDETIGYALIHKINELNVIWLDYMAIKEELRGFGFGTLFFHKILETDDLNGIFFEVEIPDRSSDEFETQMRRENFYKRLGAKKFNFDYLFPSKDGGFEMSLFFLTHKENYKPSRKQIQETISTIYKNIHTDIKNRNDILSEFINDVRNDYKD